MNSSLLPNSQSSRSRCLAMSLMAALMPAVTHAAVMWQPTGVTTTMFSESFAPPTHTINQSGASSPYTTGVTDFDAYIASNPTHNQGNVANFWEGSKVGDMDYNLGGTVPISAIVFWNYSTEGTTHVTSFELYADDNAAFSSPVLLGSFSPSLTNNSFAAVSPDVFTFAPTEASHVRLRITNNGGALFSRFGEVAFAAVPEPSGALLAGLGMLSIALRRRRA